MYSMLVVPFILQPVSLAECDERILLPTPTPIVEEFITFESTESPKYIVEQESCVEEVESESVGVEDYLEYYQISDEDLHALARTLYGECRGIPSETERAAVAWVVLNRVDAKHRGSTILEVVSSPSQFTGYSKRHPVRDDLLELAKDVVLRWCAEKSGESDVGRVIPSEYLWFAGRKDGRNYFRDKYRGGNYWDWSLDSPYDT